MCWALGVGHSRPVDRPFRHLNGSGVEVALRAGRQTRTAGTCRSFAVAGWCHGIIHTAPPLQEMLRQPRLRDLLESLNRMDHQRIPLQGMNWLFSIRSGLPGWNLF